MGRGRKPPVWAALRRPCCRCSVETFGVCKGLADGVDAV